jgi:excisionase family DNA binding protein
MDSQFINIKQAAGLLQLSPRYLYEKVRQGQLPHYKFGRAIRFNRAELLDYTGFFKAGPKATEASSQ